MVDTNVSFVKDLLRTNVGIAERLKEERLRLGLSQADFAALAGAHRKSQGNYELGERVPDAAYLVAIARAGADVTYVLTGVHVDELTRQRIILMLDIQLNAELPGECPEGELEGLVRLSEAEVALVQAYRSDDRTRAALGAIVALGSEVNSDEQANSYRSKSLEELQHFAKKYDLNLEGLLRAYRDAPADCQERAFSTLLDPSGPVCDRGEWEFVVLYGKAPMSRQAAAMAALKGNGVCP